MARPRGSTLEKKRPTTQCPYCSLYFENVGVHEMLVHKGEKPNLQTPTVPGNAGPGTIIRPPSAPGETPSPPYKTPWSRAWLENGYECRACPPGISRYIGAREKCDKCGLGPVTRMFPMVDYEPMRDMTVTYNGVRYDLKGGQINSVPSVIRDLARESIAEDRDVTRQRQQGDPSIRRLDMVGFLPPLEEDKSF